MDPISHKVRRLHLMGLAFVLTTYRVHMERMLLFEQGWEALKR